MKKITLSFLFSILGAVALSQTTPKDIVDKFFDKWEKDELQAIDYAFSTSKIHQCKG